MGRVMLGYSGGIDSTFLAVVARRALGPHRFLAVLGVSPSLGEAQHRRARELARQFDLPLRELATDELADPGYAANPLNRCYFCKRTLWRAIGGLAAAEGWHTIVDGTNADDLGEHRPGARAGVEHAVRTPLADLGWTKSAVRAAARELGIPGWNAPAAPCLASRIEPHLGVTVERLGRVEAAEAAVREVGVTGDLRVRHHDHWARIEVAPEMFPVVDRAMPELIRTFHALGFQRVERDPRGYRRGSLVVRGG
jgi:uncharacterized protein